MNTQRYCRRRPSKNCKIRTFNKYGICSGCKDDLEQLAMDLQFIKELDIKVYPPTS